MNSFLLLGYCIKYSFIKPSHVGSKMAQGASTTGATARAEAPYWDFGHANSGSAEGFNTKVWLLMKQSYGLRDFKYLKLKIMDLPSRKIRVSI